MGADLYLQRAHEETRSVWEPIFDQRVAARDRAVQRFKVEWKEDPMIFRVSPMTGETCEVPSNWPPKQIADNEEIRRLQDAVEDAHDNLYSPTCHLRENYGGGGLLSFLGLSWWNDFTKFLDENGVMSAVKAQEWIDLLEAATFPEITDEHVKLFGGESKEKIAGYYRDLLAEHIAFFRRSIETKDEIFASV